MQKEQNDILSELDNISLNTDEEKDITKLLEDIESININNNKNQIKIFINGFIFMIKYIFTSIFIFTILLITTNYSAYYGIVKNYVFEEELQLKSKGIISSVEASNIKEKFQKQIKEENNLIKNSENQKTSNYSIRKLINISNKNDINLNIEITPYENRIIIPKIGKNIPLIDIKSKQINGEKELENIFMKELEKGVIRYPGSSKPGENGTTFIFGHSSNFPWIKGDYNEVFALLDNINFEDEILIYYNQKKYKYKIREKKVITPGDVSVLERNKKKSELTLMTCWPLGTTLNRLIVVGELVKE